MPSPPAKGANASKRRHGWASGRGILWVVLGISLLCNLYQSKPSFRLSEDGNNFNSNPQPCKQPILKYDYLNDTIGVGSLFTPEETTNNYYATAGPPFDGKKTRSFEGRRIMAEEAQNIESIPKQRTPPPTNSCSNWIVIATISAPSTAVKRAASLPGWCTVIVADSKTPTDYLKTLMAGLESGNSNVHYLSVDDQTKMSKHEGRVGQFVKAIPFGGGHYLLARKNVGYLYAVQQKAVVIFDLDDNNLLDLDALGNTVSPIPTTDKARVAVIGNKVVFNHHSLMGASVKDSWARGFPLSQTEDPATRGFEAYNDEPWMSIEDPNTKIAVLQICANGDPDTDAIHRMIKSKPSLPMTFNTTKKKPLIVPIHHTFAPYNAQATVHSQKAHWALLLPCSVPGRVSDIWRGYFAQALFRTLDLHVAFLPPTVSQDRTSSAYSSHQADVKEELDLCLKTDKLVEFLSEWKCAINSSRASLSLTLCMEQLWIDLYERQYIELNDIHLVQLWLGALIESGYNFPAIIQQRHDEVVLMGQFNFPSPFLDVLFWHQKYRKWVKHVVVRGPFSDPQLKDLRAHGIDAHFGRNDKGFVSPTENLMRTLQQYRDVPGVAGVLYAHDDAVVHLPRLFQKYPTGEQHVITSFDARDPRIPIDDKHIVFLNGLSYKVQPDGSFLKQNGVRAKSVAELVPTLIEWWHHPYVSATVQKILQDPRSQKYREKDGSILVAPKGQSDFFYVPINLTDVFSEAAQLFTDYDLFLECAFPLLADISRDKFGFSVQSASLCTSWNDAIRGKVTMFDTCTPDWSLDIYHPYKLGANGYKKWSETIDKLTAKN